MPIITRGDVLPALGTLPVFHPERRPHRRVALVWGCDLRLSESSWNARHELKVRAKAAIESSARVAGLDRIVLVYVRPAGIAAHSVLATAERLTQRFEAQLERVHGRQIEVIALDVTECDDSSGLCSKLWEHVIHPAALDGTALEWAEIESTSIRSAIRSIEV